MHQLIDNVSQLPAGFLAGAASMEFPSRILMSPPRFFDVVDVKNPHMAANIGRIDTQLAQRQWADLKATFERCGATVELIEPVEYCEDMVFCANQTFIGPMAGDEKRCLLSRMRHASRRREVPAFEEWFRSRGYSIRRLTEGVGFEGSGDAIWHPGRRVIWGGYGYRSEARAYEYVSEVFDAPVLRLALQSEAFYHLDTCFCAVSESTALVHSGSLAPQAVALVRAVFRDVIDVPDNEARCGMACNACSLFGKIVVIQRDNARTVAALRERGFEVVEVETGEFLKSGGSVFCMKMYVF